MIVYIRAGNLWNSYFETWDFRSGSGIPPRNVKRGKRSMPKTMKKIWNIVTTVLLLLVVILAILLAGVRLVGLQPFAILSGSMEPTYPVGSIIYVKKVAPEDVQVGDPITYVMNEDLLVCTHRVVAVDSDDKTFRTKGDANDTEDFGGVHFNNLIGVPQFHIPYLGYVSDFVVQPPGLYVMIIGGVILLILIALPELLDSADKADKRADKKKSSKAAGEE